eukprot:TRINITY_DN5541_c0_g1_i1.p1 TRINITY_DN5541_c0_g1~~TRINITY_DN5541_c0_g1_i1.p1  ORF type:complete len:278 (+),score=66.05 TRINITY_DN5541_c0_g1_i1:42-875(+)
MSERDEDSKHPLLGSGKPQDVAIADQIQALSQLVLNLDRGMKQMGTSTDTKTFRRKLHGHVAEGMQLSQEINRELRGFQGVKKNRLNIAYHKELKKLEDLGKELLLKDRQMLARLSTNNLNEYLPTDKQSSVGMRSNHDIVDLEHGNSQSRQEQRQDLSSPRISAMNATRQELDPDVAMLDDRSLALRDIAAEVQMVNEIMKDMAYLVEEQQVVVDRIEVNTTTAAEKTKEGEQQIKEAAKYQKKSRNWQCWLLLILLLVLTGLVLGFIVVPKLLHK